MYDNTWHVYVGLLVAHGFRVSILLEDAFPILNQPDTDAVTRQKLASRLDVLHPSNPDETAKWFNVLAKLLEVSVERAQDLLPHAGAVVIHKTVKPRPWVYTNK